MRSKRDAVQGWELGSWDTLVRGTISKGRFVQGAQHPRTFGRGHIGRGHINPAGGGVGPPRGKRKNTKPQVNNKQIEIYKSIIQAIEAHN